MQDVLVVVDMQNDFVTGSLGTAEAVAVVPQVTARVAEAVAAGERIYFTRDTHQPDYLSSQEGGRLPVPHCIRETDGWQIIPALRAYADGRPVVDKPTFGSTRLAEALTEENAQDPIGRITLIGLCTDICVISNALLLKAYLPEVPICVDAACCAGVTPESHGTALSAMKVCQIDVLHE